MGVQVWPVIDPPAETARPKLKTVRSNVDNNQQQISKSRNRNQQVGWWIFTWKLSPTNSTGLPLSLRHRSAQISTRSSKNSIVDVKIQQDLHRWCRDPAKSPPSFKVAILHRFQPKSITAHSNRNQLNLWFLAIDNGLAALPLEVVRSVPS